MYAIQTKHVQDQIYAVCMRQILLTILHSGKNIASLYVENCCGISPKH